MLRAGSCHHRSADSLLTHICWRSVTVITVGSCWHPGTVSCRHSQPNRWYQPTSLSSIGHSPTATRRLNSLSQLPVHFMFCSLPVHDALFRLFTVAGCAARGPSPRARGSTWRAGWSRWSRQVGRRSGSCTCWAPLLRSSGSMMSWMCSRRLWSGEEICVNEAAHRVDKKVWDAEGGRGREREEGGREEGRENERDYSSTKK